MKLSKVTIKNFRSFGAEPIEISLDPKSTMLIGPNNSGKTAFMDALVKLFGNFGKFSPIESSDFHIPPGKTLNSYTQHDLFLEAQFDFPELVSEGGLSTFSVPSFDQNIFVNELGEASLNIRLSATWTPGVNPDGVIEQKIEYLTEKNESNETQDYCRVQRSDLDRIQLIYIPAMRKPSELLKMGKQSFLWQMLRSISWTDDFQEELTTISSTLNELIGNQEKPKAISDELKCAWNDFYHSGRFFKEIEAQFSPSELDDILKTFEVTFKPTPDGHSIREKQLGDGLRSLLYFSLISVFIRWQHRIINGYINQDEDKHLADSLPALYFKFSQSEILKTFESARLTTFLIPSYVH